ncbi:MAG: isoprenylcysteine carboxylmethyltransferase family protein [Bryobacteraceae bacterium]
MPLKPFLRAAVIGLLLLGGWGLDDVGGFFRDPARCAACFLLVAFVVLTPLLRKPAPLAAGTRPHASQCWLILSSQAAILFLQWFLPHADRHSLWTFADPGVRAAGVFLFVAGGAIQLWAIHTLDRQYSPFVTIQKNHQLVQGGAYRFVRHPIYLGLLIGFPGLILVFRSRVVFPALILTVLFIALRIQWEERLLHGEFGQQFTSYRQQTARLIPYIY